jgi:hypothetical protein
LEYRWRKTKLDLENVIDGAQQFLRGRGFIVRREEEKSSVRLVAARRKEKYEVGLVQILISQSKEELSIKFEAGDRMKPLLKFSSVFSLWGGGSIILKELKITEQYERLEEEFWREMETIVSASPA